MRATAGGFTENGALADAATAAPRSSGGGSCKTTSTCTNEKEMDGEGDQLKYCSGGTYIIIRE